METVLGGLDFGCLIAAQFFAVVAVHNERWESDDPRDRIPRSHPHGAYRAIEFRNPRRCYPLKRTSKSHRLIRTSDVTPAIKRQASDGMDGLTGRATQTVHGGSTGGVK